MSRILLVFKLLIQAYKAISKDLSGIEFLWNYFYKNHILHKNFIKLSYKKNLEIKFFPPNPYLEPRSTPGSLLDDLVLELLCASLTATV